MKLKSIITGLAVCRIEHIPNPHVFLPDLVKFIQERYKFVDFPQTVEQFTGDSFAFKLGHYNGSTIGELTLYNEAIFASAEVATDVLDTFITELIQSARSEFQMNIVQLELQNLYNSRIEVEVKSGFDNWLNTFKPISDQLASAASKAGIVSTGYGLVGFSLGAEGPDVVKPGRFLFERRAGNAFSDNVFFSEAPLSTLAHIELIERLETLF